jgi:hypothetical protein
MRAALGDGYVDALRGVWQEVPDSADFVMFWWQHAASLVRAGQAERFGFITTNSLRQTFNRRVLEAALNPVGRVRPAGRNPTSDAEASGYAALTRPTDTALYLAYAIPDHPWVDSADGAAVRIAMTVGVAGEGEGRLLSVTAERETGGEGLEVELSERVGLIHADLSIGANVAAAKALRANDGISQRGLELGGAGFIVTPEEAAKLEADAPIKPYRNGRDLTERPRGVKVIDLFGLSADEVRGRYPAVFQWVLERVKPERDHNRDEKLRQNWWLHRRLREDLRTALVGLPRYIATVETAKHRLFQFLDAAIAPDNKLICIALDDAYSLGVLSSRVHVAWALATGSHLGVGNDPVYVKTRCFETFPFPEASPEQQTRIAALAEQLDALRKRVLAEHPNLTLTGLYNVLEKLRTMENVGRKSGLIAPSAECAHVSLSEGAALFRPTNDLSVSLTTKEKDIHQRGLVGVLKSLHDELDAEVLAAYGWKDQPDSATLLTRLVALNTQRSAEEAAGTVRWLRPEFQNPQADCVGWAKRSVPNVADAAIVGHASGFAQPTDTPLAKLPWPASLPEQVAAVARVLVASPIPLSEAAIAARFSGKGAWKKRLLPLLETLVALGRARVVDGVYVSEL